MHDIGNNSEQQPHLAVSATAAAAAAALPIYDCRQYRADEADFNSHAYQNTHGVSREM